MKSREMKAARTKQRWLIAIAASLLWPATDSFAEITTPINQLGRIVGAGWGDGYHACQTSGLRLGADLPPRSYSQRATGRSTQGAHWQAGGVANFYDDFDAGSGRAVHRSQSLHQDIQGETSRIIIDGSRVIQSPRGSSPLSPERAMEVIPAPQGDPEFEGARLVPRAPQAMMGAPVGARGTQAGAGLDTALSKVPPTIEARPSVRPRPVRPTLPPRQVPVDLRSRRLDASVANTRTRRLPVPAEVASPAAQTGRHMTTTPRMSRPIHPGGQHANRRQQLLRSTLAELNSTPQSSRLRFSIPVPRAVVPQAVVPQAVVPRAVVPRAVVYPPAATVNQPARTATGAYDLQATMDRIGGASAARSDRPVAPPVAVNPPPAVKAASRARPVRLGQQPAKPGRPKRLGSGPPRPARPGLPLQIHSASGHTTPGVRSNPLVLPRAVLELARRSPTSGTLSVRQPQ